MYIIEKIIKLYTKYKNNDSSPVIIEDKPGNDLEDVVTCKHNFMPIDSTGNILACSKCGYLVRKKRLKNKKV